MPAGGDGIEHQHGGLLAADGVEGVVGAEPSVSSCTRFTTSSLLALMVWVAPNSRA